MLSRTLCLYPRKLGHSISVCIPNIRECGCVWPGMQLLHGWSTRGDDQGHCRAGPLRACAACVHARGYAYEGAAEAGAARSAVLAAGLPGAYARAIGPPRSAYTTPRARQFPLQGLGGMVSSSLLLRRGGGPPHIYNTRTEIWHYMPGSNPTNKDWYAHIGQAKRSLETTGMSCIDVCI